MEKRSFEELASMLHDAAAQVPVGSHWQHYKGGRYTIVQLAISEETQEVVIVYQSLEHADVRFVRPFAIWQETVEWQGQTVARFSPLD